MAKAAIPAAPPSGYAMVPEGPEAHVQGGDLLWCVSADQWQEPERWELGEQVSTYYGVARKVPASA